MTQGFLKDFVPSHDPGQLPISGRNNWSQRNRKVQGTLRYSDILALEVSTASPRKNHTPLLKLSYFQEAMEIYERKFQRYMTPLRTPLSYSSLNK
ncbi:hypothetical protein ACFX12_035894 [Malus domestica]